MHSKSSYRQAVRDLAAALCGESRAWKVAAGLGDGRAVSAADLDDYFLTITERALDAVPNAILISILSARTRQRLEQEGFDMQRVLPLSPLARVETEPVG